MSTRQLPDWLDGYMTYTTNSEPAEQFRLWVGISVIASCLMRKVVLNWGHLTFYPNMYVVLVGPSGCRKGTAMGPGLKLLNDLGIKIAAESTTREALIRALNESADTQYDGGLRLHSSLTIYSEELTVFLGYNNMQLIADLCDWFDCRDHWTYRTKQSGVDEIQGVWVNLIGATTPALLQTTLPLDAIGGGLTSRIVFVYAAGKGKVVPFPFPTQEEMDVYKNLIHDLERIRMLSGEFKVTQSFLKAWEKWYTTSSQDVPIFTDAKFTGYIERRPTHAIKLSMIFSASRGDSLTLDEIDLLRATQTLHQVERNMSKTFLGVGQNKMAPTLVRVMRYLEKNTHITRANLQRMFFEDASKWEMDEVLSTMRSMGYIHICLDANTGVEHIEWRGSDGQIEDRQDAVEGSQKAIEAPTSRSED